MSERRQPWWSSGPGATHAAPGPAAEERVRDDGYAGSAAGGPTADDGGPEVHDHADAHPNGEVCAICPVCSLLRVIGETRPEVTAHLIEAARHLTAAAKAVVDAQASHLGDPSGLEHIPLDDD